MYHGNNQLKIKQPNQRVPAEQQNQQIYEQLRYSTRSQDHVVINVSRPIKFTNRVERLSTIKEYPSSIQQNWGNSQSHSQFNPYSTHKNMNNQIPQIEKIRQSQKRASINQNVNVSRIRNSNSHKTNMQQTILANQQVIKQSQIAEKDSICDIDCEIM